MQKNFERLKLKALSVARLFWMFALCFIAFSAIGQTGESIAKDTVFILFNKTNNKVIESGLAVYHKPDLPYPMDVSRSYFIQKYERLKDRRRPLWSLSVIHLDFNPERNEHSLIQKANFLQSDYIDQAWFNQRTYKEIMSYLEGKLLYLVNDSYLYDGKFFMMRVILQDNVEID